MNGFWLNRRHFTSLLLGAAGAAALPGRLLANNQPMVPLHGLSAFGELKYQPDFQHFDYANVDAPAGGRMVLTVPNWLFNQAPDTFDTLNSFVLQGNAPPRIEKLYDTLMVSALDEPDSIYCALAESVSMAEDGNSFTFRIRPEAMFSNGEPVLAEDVAFSYRTLKEEGHPSLMMVLAELSGVEVTAEREVRLDFTGRQTVPAALGTMAGIPILPAAFFAGKEFTRTGMEPIPGSGNYRIGRFEPGRFIEYEKRDDYWGTNLPFARGLDHFQTLRIEFFRDRQTALQAFKKGEITCRQEFTTKAWATEYDIPAVRDGRILKREFPGEKRPKFQCWALNQRRARFADPRVRQAINLCFDFEWTNANLMYGLRTHSDSCFQGSEFVATGTPGPEELALLEPLRNDLPASVFETAWTQPVSDGSGFDRAMLRQANELLTAAGWTRQGGGLVNQNGELFTLEYMINDPEQQRVYGKMIENLKRLGINASFRLVDPAQYQDRQNRFDFDMMLVAFSLSATPTPDSLRMFFGSSMKDVQGGYNFPGMASPAIDTLIEQTGTVNSRDELVTVMRCIDRTLRARLDWVPNITSDVHHVAFWNMYGMADTKPDYGFPVESLWWYDEDKARNSGRG
ncbi:ABC transporter substrate-binding protein [Aureimonas fodinaquatilis]|uniref:ABC transporter substrate-binding protein n=1 Tax=Aureimonas fodinaquatilis TaxID=2565783 RepID=A0A5B0E0Z4_9HYPH|nr:extracellular solute-binding protein [Aureimonas fodinaquatilis]KAA0972336.1 ABC transporter substrate-binding protein [Aureimonas fodinaquatilis]